MHLLLSILATAPSASAYEVDPWTGRSRELAPADALADAELNRALDAAAEAVARRCPRDPDKLHDALARAVFRETGRRDRVEGLPLRRSFGHGTYSGWLETAAIDRIDGGTGTGVFTGLDLIDSPILAWAGTASTVSLGGQLVGTDKVDHFLATGYRYWQWSRGGEDIGRAVRKGTTSERMFLGRVTSNAFSYADLAANLDGYQFYADLLDGVFAPDVESCVVRVADVHWADLVHGSWDELRNPSVYGKRVARQIATNLADDREALCAMWVNSPRVLRPETVLGQAPPVEGPLGLPDFCDGLPVVRADAVPVPEPDPQVATQGG